MYPKPLSPLIPLNGHLAPSTTPMQPPASTGKSGSGSARGIHEYLQSSCVVWLLQEGIP